MYRSRKWTKFAYMLEICIHEALEKRPIFGKVYYLVSYTKHQADAVQKIGIGIAF